MIVNPPVDIPSSEITPESVFMRRREFIGRSAAFAAAAALSSTVGAKTSDALQALNYRSAPADNLSGFYTGEALTPNIDVSSYCNFYEFGSSKDDPARYAHNLVTDPWSLTIEGEVEKPGVYQLEDILKRVDLEERIYRLRCVEAWSMVIPWVGFSLAELLRQFQPTSKAKYVQFYSVIYSPHQNNPQICV